MNELALFAGAGGGILGGVLLGWRCVCAVEIDPYARGVLLARQRDGALAPFPVWDDVRTFDGRPWRGFVDVVSGGFPCTDISVAGKGAGIDGKESGLWREMARIVGEVRPRHVLVENSPALVVRGLGRVLGDLAALGYDCRWDVLGAAHVGAPHLRRRLWIAAHDSEHRRGEGRPGRPDPGFAGKPQQPLPLDVGADADLWRREGEREQEHGREQGPSGREPQRLGEGGWGPGSDDVAHADGEQLRLVPGGLCREGGAAGEAELAEHGSYGDVADAERTERGADKEKPAGRGQAAAFFRDSGADVADASGPGLPAPEREDLPGEGRGLEGGAVTERGWWSSEPAVGRMAHRVAHRVDRLRALGNGQVPAVVGAAWKILS